MKPALVLLAALAVAAAWGQGRDNPYGVRARIAYGFTPSFDTDGGSGTMQGPEVAVALPIGSFLKRQVLLEPSFYGGGRLRHGGDNDSDIYRLTAFLHGDFGRGIGGRVGVGFAAATRARGGGFGSTSDIVFDFGVEIPFAFQRIAKYQPYVDVHAVLSPTDRLNGYFAGIGLRL